MCAIKSFRNIVPETLENLLKGKRPLGWHLRFKNFLAVFVTLIETTVQLRWNV